MFSDHRPVYGIFDCTVKIINESLRDALSRQIYDKQNTIKPTTVGNLISDETDDEDSVGLQSIADGLPPSSSDYRKWWLDQGGSVVIFCLVDSANFRNRTSCNLDYQSSSRFLVKFATVSKPILSLA